MSWAHMFRRAGITRTKKKSVALLSIQSRWHERYFLVSKNWHLADDMSSMLFSICFTTLMSHEPSINENCVSLLPSSVSHVITFLLNGHFCHHFPIYYVFILRFLRHLPIQQRQRQRRTATPVHAGLHLGGTEELQDLFLLGQGLGCWPSRNSEFHREKLWFSIAMWD